MNALLYVPQRAVILSRISDARQGDTHGVDDQVKMIRAYAERMGWTIGPDDTHVLIENDTSGFKRYKVCPACLQRARGCLCPPLPNGEKRRTELRTWRPRFRLALEMLRSGAADGLLVRDLSRLGRDMRDGEDLLDVLKCRRTRIPAQGVSGLRLESTYDETNFRVGMAIAHGSSEDTSQRVQWRREEQAATGRFGGGNRRFGRGLPVVDDRGNPRLDKDDQLVVDRQALRTEEAITALAVLVARGDRQATTISTLEDANRVLAASAWVRELWPEGAAGLYPEADEVRAWAKLVLGGVSLRWILADLRERKVPTANGGEWDPSRVREILCAPGVAGLATHRRREKMLALREQGKPVPVDVGVVGEASWDAIIDPETWRAVAGLLANPARRTSPGNTPKWLGSLIYACGMCELVQVEQTVTVGGRSRAGRPRYVCRGPVQHLGRTAEATDEFVQDVIMARLEQPDAVELGRRPGAAQDKGALYDELNTLQGRKANVTQLVAEGLLELHQARVELKPLNDRISEIEGLLASTAERSPLEGLPVGTPSIREVWPTLPLGVKRAVLQVLMDVTLLPSHRGRTVQGRYFDPDSVRITWKR